MSAMDIAVKVKNLPILRLLEETGGAHHENGWLCGGSCGKQPLLSTQLRRANGVGFGWLICGSGLGPSAEAL